MRSNKIIVLSVVFVSAALLFSFRTRLLTAMGEWLVVQSRLEKVDLVVPLGGDRTRQDRAVSYLKQGLAQRIFLVGPDVRPNDYRCMEVPDEKAMPLAEPAFTTHEEALRVRKIAGDYAVRSVLVVTSNYHLRRTKWVFEKVFNGSGVTLRFASAPARSFRIETWWQTYMGRKTVLLEYLALALYYVTVR